MNNNINQYMFVSDYESIVKGLNIDVKSSIDTKYILHITNIQNQLSIVFNDANLQLPFLLDPKSFEEMDLYNKLNQNIQEFVGVFKSNLGSYQGFAAKVISENYEIVRSKEDYGDFIGGIFIGITKWLYFLNGVFKNKIFSVKNGLIEQLQQIWYVYCIFERMTLDIQNYKSNINLIKSIHQSNIVFDQLTVGLNDLEKFSKLYSQSSINLFNSLLEIYSMYYPSQEDKIII